MGKPTFDYNGYLITALGGGIVLFRSYILDLMFGNCTTRLGCDWWNLWCGAISSTADLGCVANHTAFTVPLLVVGITVFILGILKIMWE